MKATALLFGLGLWQAVVSVGHLPVWLLPGPLVVGQRLWQDAGLFAQNAEVTLLETLLGLALATAAGAIFGLLLYIWPLGRTLLYPWLVASQTVPMVVVAPIAALWFGYGLLPKVLVVALVDFFPVTVGVLDGLRGLDPDLLRLQRTLGASSWLTLREVQVPGAMPSFFSGFKLAVAYSVVAAVLAEWMGASRGLGYLILRAKSQLDAPRMFAAVVILMALGAMLFALAQQWERHVLAWRGDRQV